MSDRIDTANLIHLESVSEVRRTPTGLAVTVDGEQLLIDVFRPDVLRLMMSAGGRFDRRPTCAVCVDDPAEADFTLEDAEDAATLATSAMTLRIGKKPFTLDAYRPDGSVVFETWRDPKEGPRTFGRLNDRFVVARRKVSAVDSFYGLGEKTGSFNRAGRNFKMWTHDIFSGSTLPEEMAHLPADDPRRDPGSLSCDPYYMSIPFYYHMTGDGESSAAAGFFLDNSYLTRFDLDARTHFSFAADGGQYTEYVFAGPSMRDILGAYTWLTGRMPAPPLWALGFHQCRWHKYDEAGIRTLAENFRGRDIPCDSLWFDIDYMDGFRVFTWDDEKFPDHKKLLADLRDDGFRPVVIIDPGVKHEEGNPVFEEGRRDGHFCKTENGSIFVGKVWPGRTAFPDFSREETRAWWGRMNAGMIEQGVSGIWNDMNEPATGVPWKQMRFDRDGANLSHERMHNQYGQLMGQATREGLELAFPETRHFILTRSGFAGIQRHSATWMGDNRSTWDFLWLSLPMALGLSISGQPFVGADVGGFALKTSPELLVRWTQCGALTPFFRNHNCDVLHQYPWAFGRAVEDICRDAIELRYRLAPYIYSTFMKSSRTGGPIQIPFIYEFQDDPVARDIEDEYLFGEALLVAPVYRQGETARTVYLPEGTWYDWWTAERIEGPAYITADAPMDRIPLYARGGQVIPMLDEVPQSLSGLAPETLDLVVCIPGADGVYVSELHEDDGETTAHRSGAFKRTVFTVTREGCKLIIDAETDGEGFPEFRRKELRLIFQGLDVDEPAASGCCGGGCGTAEPARILVDGEERALDGGVLLMANSGESFAIELDL